MIFSTEQSIKTSPIGRENCGNGNLAGQCWLRFLRQCISMHTLYIIALIDRGLVAL